MSCLFNSISTFVTESPESLRSQACDYLERNGRLFDDKHATEVVSSDYIKNMRRVSEWGGGVEIRALCELLNLTVVVSGPTSVKPIIFQPLEVIFGNRHVFLNYNGSHYEPMSPIIFST